MIVAIDVMIQIFGANIASTPFSDEILANVQHDASTVVVRTTLAGTASVVIIANPQLRAEEDPPPVVVGEAVKLEASQQPTIAFALKVVVVLAGDAFLAEAADPLAADVE